MNTLQYQQQQQGGGNIGRGSGFETITSSDVDYYPGMKPDEVSTGTTIMAIPIDGGVILGADTRVTTGIYIVNRISDKIAQISEHIFICRSGSAADCQALSDYCKFYLQQLEIETGSPARVKTAAHLLRRLVYQNKNNLSAGCIVAGWDPVDNGSVYHITMGGSMLQVPFALGGSGSSYIYGLMDAKFHSLNGQPLSKDDGLTLVKQVVAHAMARDGGSGGCIRTVTLTSEGNEYSFTPGNELPFGPTSF